METSGIGRFVRDRRHELGLRQQDVAETAGISQARVAQIEAGTVKLPGADHRRGLAKALRVSHLDLLIAAGEITPEELGSAAGVVEPVEAGPLAELRALLETVPLTERNVNYLRGVLSTLAHPTQATVRGLGTGSEGVRLGRA